MVKFICDRCNQIIETSDRNHVSYTCDNGTNSADLCKGCYEEFLNWMGTNHVCINTEEQKRIDKVEERIANVELALGKMSNELWLLKRAKKN